MKQSLHIIKKVFLLTLGLFSTLAMGQTVENFEYTSGELLTDNGYGSLGDAPAVYVNNSGLEYSGLAVSGVGNAAHIEISSGTSPNVSQNYGLERIAKRDMFSSSKSSGTIYLSFIAKIQSTIDSEDLEENFFISMSNYQGWGKRGRVYAKDNGSGKVMFGFTKGHSLPNWVTTPYDYGKTYLFVVKYEILDGDDNDVASLFIFDAATDGVPTSEPTAADLTASDGNDPGNIKQVHLRQRKVDAIVDGIIMGTSWENVVLSNSPYPQYYIDSVGGDDSNAGNSSDSPWRTLLNLKSVVLDPGNTVYLKRGSEWNEVFSFNGSGSSGNPILIKPYGS